ncbi:MAG TPA: hypothetical protein VGF99_06670 [Myxococcota bacterium]
MIDIERLKGLWVRDLRVGDYTIEIVDVVARGDDAIATVRGIHWDGDAVRDIREQEAKLGALDDFDDDDGDDGSVRNVALVEAWAAVVEQLLGTLDDDDFYELMPADLIFSDLPHLVTCQTREQFDTALRAKKRLGARLPAA